MGWTSVTEQEHDSCEYDNMLAALTQASARLDVLQAAVSALCRLCEKQDVDGETVLDVLETHGALTKAARARYHAA